MDCRCNRINTKEISRRTSVSQSKVKRRKTEDCDIVHENYLNKIESKFVVQKN